MKTRTTILIILFVLSISTFFIGKKLCDPDWKGILLGITSSSLVVFFIETIISVKEFFRLGFLSKTYKRSKITNTLAIRDSNGKYEDLTQSYIDKGVNPEISLKYKGEGEYEGDAFYEQGKVKFTICLDKTNPKIGIGSYQYVEKEKGFEIPDLGTYSIQVDNNNKNKAHKRKREE